MSILGDSYEYFDHNYIQQNTVHISDPRSTSLSMRNGFLFIPAVGMVKNKEYACHGLNTVNISDRLRELAEDIGIEIDDQRECTKLHDDFYQLSNIVSSRFTMNGDLELRCYSLGQLDLVCMKDLKKFMFDNKLSYVVVGHQKRIKSWVVNSLIELYESMEN